jgi:2Fe-2S ferredoxin
MPTVTYIQSTGQSHEINLDSGKSLMQGAVDNLIDGILAECGGSCSCATCHCYVHLDWVDKIEPPSEMENDLLGCVTEPQLNSRLSCQIIANESHDGLTVYLPKSQF